MTALAEMQLHVTDTLGLQLPPRMISTWLRDGHTRVQTHATWPWLHRDTVMTVAATGPPTGGTPLPRARRVLSVVDSEHGPLTEMPWTTALTRYPPGSSHSSSRPQWFTALEDRAADPADAPQILLRVWPPAPADRDSVIVSTLVEHDPWPTPSTPASEPPPLPAAFHDLLPTWAVNKAYLSEADTELARPHFAEFQSQLSMLVDQYVSVSGAQLHVGGSADASTRYGL